MTPNERLEGFFSGKPIDRIPCSPMLGETMTQRMGIKACDYQHSATLMAEVEIRCYQMFRHDGVGAGPGLPGLAEAMGTELFFPEYGIPYVVKPVMRDKALEELTPANPYKDGRLPTVLEALKILKETLSDQVGVGSFVPGPLTTAAAIRGTESLLRELVKEPERAHAVLALATQSALNYIDALCNMGVMPSIAEPAASCSLSAPTNSANSFSPI